MRGREGEGERKIYIYIYIYITQYLYHTLVVLGQLLPDPVSLGLDQCFALFLLLSQIPCLKRHQRRTRTTG